MRLAQSGIPDMAESRGHGSETRRQAGSGASRGGDVPQSEKGCGGCTGSRPHPAPETDATETRRLSVAGNSFPQKAENQIFL